MTVKSRVVRTSEKGFLQVTVRVRSGDVEVRRARSLAGLQSPLVSGVLDDVLRKIDPRVHDLDHVIIADVL